MIRGDDKNMDKNKGPEGKGKESKGYCYYMEPTSTASTTKDCTLRVGSADAIPLVLH